MREHGRHLPQRREALLLRRLLLQDEIPPQRPDLPGAEPRQDQHRHGDEEELGLCLIDDLPGGGRVEGDADDAEAGLAYIHQSSRPDRWNVEGGRQFIDFLPGAEHDEFPDQTSGVPRMGKCRIVQPVSHEPGVGVRDDRPVALSDREKRDLPPVLSGHQRLERGGVPSASGAGLGGHFQGQCPARCSATPAPPAALSCHSLKE